MNLSNSEGDHSFGVEIISYEVNGDLNSSDSHVFGVQIWVCQDIYTIKRSYTNFCDFDSRLHRKYPKSNLPECPLAGSTTIKLLKSVVGKSVVGTNKRTFLKKGMDTSEVVSQKKVPLTKYLSDLLNIPEIVRSNELLNFLDIESSDGDEVTMANISTTEYLLRTENPTTVKVIRRCSVPFPVKAKQYITWRFFTKKKDIGFSIQIDDRVVLPYQRYNSHEEVVEGLMEVPLDGTATLLWDNAYSKVRSKLLTYVHRVVDSDLYLAASRSCRDISREKHESEVRRSALRKALFERSDVLLESTGLRSTISLTDFNAQSQMSGDTALYEDLQGVIEQLRGEKESLQLALSFSEQTINELRGELEGYKSRENLLDRMMAEHEGVNSRMEELQKENDKQREENKELNSALAKAQEELKVTRQTMEECSRQSRRDSTANISMQQQQAALYSQLHELTVDLEQQKSAATVSEAQIQRLKGEKKQLKTYALQLKTKAEELEESAGLWNTARDTVNNLVHELGPLRKELGEQIASLEMFKQRFAAAIAELPPTEGSGALMEDGTAALFCANNSASTATMMCEFAEMKGIVPAGTSSRSVELSTGPVNTSDMPSNENGPDRKSSLIDTMKLSLRDIGNTMLEAEQSFDKLLQK
mmetsp:Transcript_15914/g.23971  ORF Transcript_15914/g.23971 Transcript_15914/m.23971 type:complete len:645 (-) Transcript_15914:76-2010(-)